MFGEKEGPGGVIDPGPQQEGDGEEMSWGLDFRW